MDVLAEAQQVSRRFGAFTAVSAVDLTVGPGEVVGLLGGNGAGKTTLIRLLLGLLRPSDGVIRLLGAAPSISTRRRVGYVPQTLGLYAGLTVEENWSFTATAFRLAGVPLPASIAPWRHELVGRLPLGVQRQVAFTVALSHRPEVLILDEPTSGTGPLGSARLWEDIRQSADDGAGVLVTTHNMEEAEQCDRLVVMAAGQVAARGTAEQIIGGRTVSEIRSGDLPRAFTVLDAGNLQVQAHGSTLRASGTADAVGRMLRQAGIDPAVETVPANLEEAFVAIVSQPMAP
jgi:ABC-2 type transport system ATP-binding protein/ribosome-dependent ATPase